jgi:hypothetical protein
MPLDQGPEGYRMFKEEGGCVRAVFRPAADCIDRVMAG